MSQGFNASTPAALLDALVGGDKNLHLRAFHTSSAQVHTALTTNNNNTINAGREERERKESNPTACDEDTNDKFKSLSSSPSSSSLLCCVAVLQGHDEGDRVWFLDWHPSGQILATCGSDKKVLIWGRTDLNDVEKEKEDKIETLKEHWSIIQTLSGEHTRTVRRLQWSPNGKELACCSFDGTISVWRQTSGVATATTTTKVDAENCPKEKKKPYDQSSFELTLISILDGHENEVKSVAWDSTGTLLATCSRDRTVWIWEKNVNSASGYNKNGEGYASSRHTGEDVVLLQQEEEEREGGEEEEEYECAAVLTGHSQDVKCVMWHPSSRILFSCGYDDSIKIWAESKDQKDDWSCVQSLHQHCSTVWDLRFQMFSSSSSCVTTAERGGTVRECIPGKGTPCSSRGKTGPGDRRVWFEPYRLLASCSDDASILLWWQAQKEQFSSRFQDPFSANLTDLPRYSFVKAITGLHERVIYSIDWSPPILLFPSENEIKTTTEEETRKVGETSTTTLVSGVSRLLCSAAGDDALCLVEVRYEEGTGESNSRTPSSSAPEVKVNVLWRQEKAHDFDVNCCRFCPKVFQRISPEEKKEKKREDANCKPKEEEEKKEDEKGKRVSPRKRSSSVTDEEELKLLSKKGNTQQTTTVQELVPSSLDTSLQAAEKKDQSHVVEETRKSKVVYQMTIATAGDDGLVKLWRVEIV